LHSTPVFKNDGKINIILNYLNYKQGIKSSTSNPTIIGKRPANSGIRPYCTKKRHFLNIKFKTFHILNEKAIKLKIKV
jgi:hypothetical protein